MKAKTAIGIIAFIFLGLCTYAAASADYNNSLQSKHITSDVDVNALTTGPTPEVTMSQNVIGWRAPIVDMGENTPIAITLALESFVLLCWWLLRKIEPKMNALAENAVMAVKKS